MSPFLGSFTIQRRNESPAPAKRLPVTVDVNSQTSRGERKMYEYIYIYYGYRGLERRVFHKKNENDDIVATNLRDEIKTYAAQYVAYYKNRIVNNSNAIK